MLNPKIVIRQMIGKSGRVSKDVILQKISCFHSIHISVFVKKRVTKIFFFFTSRNQVHRHLGVSIVDADWLNQITREPTRNVTCVYTHLRLHTNNLQYRTCCCGRLYQHLSELRVFYPEQRKRVRNIAVIGRWRRTDNAIDFVAFLVEIFTPWAFYWENNRQDFLFEWIINYRLFPTKV